MGNPRQARLCSRGSWCSAYLGAGAHGAHELLEGDELLAWVVDVLLVHLVRKQHQVCPHPGRSSARTAQSRHGGEGEGATARARVCGVNGLGSSGRARWRGRTCLAKRGRGAGEDGLSRAQSLTISVMESKLRHCPVGLPGLMMTIAFTLIPLARAALRTKGAAARVTRAHGSGGGGGGGAHVRFCVRT